MLKDFKTIESVIPPLVEALRKQKSGPLAGTSELLLSFVAAFEHIPNHRRSGLFSSLIDKLGAEEFLFALLILLLDRYADSREIKQFIQEFTSQYSPLIQLKVGPSLLDGSNILLANMYSDYGEVLGSRS